MNFRRFSAVALVTALACASVALADLSESDAKKFAATLTDAKSLADRLEESGKDDVFKAEFVPEKGKSFEPFTQVVKGLEQELPKEHGELESIVKKHGFSSSASWATIGDQVIRAYVKLGMAENPQLQMMISQMTPEMLNQVPAEMRPQIEGMLALVEQIQATPESDVAAVRTIKDDLDQFMNMQGVQTGF